MPGAGPPSVVDFSHSKQAAAPASASASVSNTANSVTLPGCRQLNQEMQRVGGRRRTRAVSWDDESATELDEAALCLAESAGVANVEVERPAHEFTSGGGPASSPVASSGRNRRVICCDPGDDTKVAQKIFREMDVEEDMIVTWVEFYLFVKHSYENFPELVGAHGATSPNPIVRFRWMLLEAVVGNAMDVERQLVQQDKGKGLIEVLFDRSRSFSGRGLVAKTRRVYQLFDDNDSGGISFNEFVEVLRDFGFFPHNIQVHGKKLQLVERSLCCCHIDNPCRIGFIRVAYSKAFDTVLVIVILCNTIVLAMEDQSDAYLAQDNPTLFSPLNQFVYTSDFWFTALYLIEFVIKVVAMGFFVGRGVYLSSWWNVFDFLLLIASLAVIPFASQAYFADYSLDSGADQDAVGIVQLLRIVRVLRPLKSITALPQMRDLAATVLAAVSALKEIFLLLFILWVVFAATLVDILSGKLNRRCHSATEAQLLQDLLLADGRNASAVARNLSDAGRGKLPLELSSIWPATDLWRPCGLDAPAAHHCFHNDPNHTIADELCLSVDDLDLVAPLLPPAAQHTYIWNNDTFSYNARMNYGLTNFDNLGFALLTLFQITSLEGWTPVMYLAQDSYHDLAAFWIFFFFMVFCGILMIGLILAVVAAVYEVQSERKLNSKSKSWSGSPGSIISLQGFKAVVRSLHAGALKRWSLRARRRVQRRSALLSEASSPKRARTRTSIDRSTLSMRSWASTDSDVKNTSGNDDWGVGPTEDTASDDGLDKGNLREDPQTPGAARKRKLASCFRAVQVVQSKQLTIFMCICVALNMMLMCTGFYLSEEYETCSLRYAGNLSAPCQEADRDFLICVSNLLFVAIFAVELVIRWTVVLAAQCMAATCAGKEYTRQREEQLIQDAGLALQATPPRVSRRKVLPAPTIAKPEDSKQSDSSMSVPQPLNRVPVQRHETFQRQRSKLRCTGQCRVDERHDEADAAATALFMASQLRKLDYVDGLVTIIAVIDLSVAGECTLTPTGETETAFTALRALSLLRILRIVANWPSLQALLGIISKSGSELFSFFVLMGFFVYMSALLGLQFFSNKFHFDADGYYVPWAPLVFNATCPPHAPWTKDAPYTRDLSNFDNFGDALLTTFQIWSGEAWNFVMYSAIRSGGPSGPVAFAYFAGGVIIGQWLLLNLLMAIMLRHFDLSALHKASKAQGNSTTSPRQRELDSATKRKMKLLASKAKDSLLKPRKDSGKIKTALAQLVRGPSFRTLEEMALDVDTDDVDSNEADAAVDSELKSRKVQQAGEAQLAAQNLNRQMRMKHRTTSHASLGIASDLDNAADSETSNAEPSLGRPSITAAAFGGHRANKVIAEVIGGDLLVHLKKRRRWAMEAWGSMVIESTIRAERKHCCFPAGRRCVYSLLESRAYGLIRSAMAVLVTVAYVVFTPTDKSFGEDGINASITLFFAFAALFFLVELMVQAAALGRHFFRIPWTYVNAMATILLLLGCIGMLFSDAYPHLKSLEFCRVGLTLFIFQVLAKLPVLRVSFAAILKSLPQFLEITVIVLIFVFSFSIVFVTEYKGKLGQCDLDSLNEDGLQLLQDEFGLTNGVVYYDFVKRGRARATSACELDDGAFLELSEQMRFDRDDCISFGGTWINPLPNFDSFYNAYMAIFHLIQTEGWVNLMQRCVAAAGQNTHPLVGFEPTRALAFVLFVLVAAIILAQMSATVLVANFELMQQKETGMLNLTTTQREWLSTLKVLAQMNLRPKRKPPNTKSSCRLGAFRLASNRVFQALSAVAAALYLTTCAAEAAAPGDDSTILWCFYLEAGFVLFFVIEITLKIVAFGSSYFVRWEQSVGSAGPRPYERRCCRTARRRRAFDSWRIVDVLSVGFCIVALLIGGISLLQYGSPNPIRDSGMFHYIVILSRVLRLLRVVGLLRRAATIKRYMVTLGHSLVAVATITVLYFVVINMAALLMRELFHDVEIDENNVGGFEPRAHFQSWLRAFSVMARTTTGESWYKIAYGMMEENDGCTGLSNVTPDSVASYREGLPFEKGVHLSFQTSFADLATNGCRSQAAFPLFAIFVYASTIVMMNVFLAVVIDAFGAHAGERRGIVRQEDFDSFLAEWKRVDEDLTLFVDVSQLVVILSRTPQPLGIAVAQGHTLAEVKNVGDLSLSGDQQRKASAVLRTTYGNLKVSLFKGKVYLYDVFAEMLRVLAVQKARARSENHGLFFQSRSAVTQLTALDTELLRKLKAKWYLTLNYEFTLREALAAVGVQKVLRGHQHRRRHRMRLRHANTAEAFSPTTAPDSRKKANLDAEVKSSGARAAGSGPDSRRLVALGSSQEEKL